MSASLFRAEARAAIIARVELGQTFVEAAEAAGYKRATARGWLARGRRESDGDYAEFAAAVERARAAVGVEAMTPEEHRQKVSEVARKGNVQALKLYWEMILADREPADETEKPKDELEALDELAARRAR
jgi:predicted transcriptional regulator